jgi:hypothetical protein
VNHLSRQGRDRGPPHHGDVELRQPRVLDLSAQLDPTEKSVLSLTQSLQVALSKPGVLPAQWAAKGTAIRQHHGKLSNQPEVAKLRARLPRPLEDQDLSRGRHLRLIHLHRGIKRPGGPAKSKMNRRAPLHPSHPILSYCHKKLLADVGDLGLAPWPRKQNQRPQQRSQTTSESVLWIETRLLLRHQSVSTFLPQRLKSRHNYNTLHSSISLHIRSQIILLSLQ